MARLLVVDFVSIDGVVQSPVAPDEDRDGGFDRGGWVIPYSDEAVTAFMSDVTTGAGALLLGRRSYEIFTAAWASADRSDPAVDAMNRMPKYVVSRSTDLALPWKNSRRIGDDLPADIARLKEEQAGDLVVFGSSGLLPGLAEHDLVDEYRLLLFPVVLGDGKRMFGAPGPMARFTLASSVTSPSGVVLLRYVRDRDAGRIG